MENANLPSEGSQSAPAAPARPGVSGWRIAAGVLVCIFTLLVTAVLLFLSICFGLLLRSSSGSYGDAPWIYGLFLVTILVPVGGVWLAVRLFRGATKARMASMGGAAAAAPVVVSTVPPQEAEERLAYLRLAIVVAILAHAALLVMNLSRYRTAAYHVPLAPAIVNFVLYEIPYVIALVGIRSRGERWALSLAFMYPIFALVATAFSLLTLIAPWRAGIVLRATLLLHYGLTAVIDVALFLFALRAWQAERRSDDGVQLLVWGVASALYLLVLHFMTTFLYRLVHF